VPAEMRRFLKWFNAPTKNDLIIKAAIAHLWFVTIHPFGDGNGRIARAITDMLLARADGSKQRFYSMSSQILCERKTYYEILQQTQKGSVDITVWMEWFLMCLKRSITASSETLQSVLDKANFWKHLRDQILNERQRKVLNLMLDGFEGKLTSSKWSKLTKCSQDTALRDINDLLDRKILVKENAGGRSTSYKIEMRGE
jgi:Fic family protein